jgi:hypothetical protein
MTIFAYVKLGLIAVCIIACSYLVYHDQHMKSVIAKQQIEIGNLKTTTGVLTEKQKTVDDFMAEKQTVQRRVAKENTGVDASVSSGDVTNVIKLFDPFRSLPTTPQKGAK